MEQEKLNPKRHELISDTPEWLNVKQKVSTLPTLRELNVPQRNETLVLNAADLTVDLTRNFLDDELLKKLVALAQTAGLPEVMNHMFTGKIINKTEGRAVLHHALRAREDQVIEVKGHNVVPDVHRVLRHMEDFTNRIQSGEWRGFSGKKIKKVVTLAIGGSSLGPDLACEALKDYANSDIESVFVSNVDPVAITDILNKSNPEETLFIIASKTFTTDEVMSNARVAKKWLTTHFKSDDAIASHFVAISTNTKAVEAFGIDPKNTFEFWDWVGGRYSMSSAIGLPIMLEIGPKNFRDMLSGFHAMDEHYRTAPLAQNLPVIMGLANILNVNFRGLPDVAIIPYSERLKKIPTYLQQLIMESLGKSVTQEGRQVNYPTGATIFGGAGTDVQHSFFESLQQGSPVPVTFIGFRENSAIEKAPNDLRLILTDQHKKLISNMVAQADTLAFGETETELRQQGVPEDLIPHKILPGNRPSTIIWAEKLTPKTFGELVSLFEHMTFVWGGGSRYKSV